MSTFASPIAYYLERYRSDDTENAFCGLTELDHAALPELIAEFRAATDSELRALLLHVIWEHRHTSVIPLLGEALREGEKPVWRQAMDGPGGTGLSRGLGESRSFGRIALSSNACVSPAARHRGVLRLAGGSD